MQRRRAESATRGRGRARRSTTVATTDSPCTMRRPRTQLDESLEANRSERPETTGSSSNGSDKSGTDDRATDATPSNGAEAAAGMSTPDGTPPTKRVDETWTAPLVPPGPLRAPHGVDDIHPNTPPVSTRRHRSLNAEHIQRDQELDSYRGSEDDDPRGSIPAACLIEWVQSALRDLPALWLIAARSLIHHRW